VARLESQVGRFKTASETADVEVDGLKTERRKTQRELRDAITRMEELETQNKYLEARLDKLKTAKSNLLKDL
jgi:chromosome segregation ATPase